MLRVEAEAISNEAMSSSLAILEREMNVVIAYLNNVGTQASLFAGFIFVMFIDVPMDTVHPFFRVLTMASSVLCFSTMIYTVVCSTVASSMGPQMALKGADSSAMRRAVEFMKTDRQRIVVAFAFGVISFELACLVLLWVKMIDEWYNAAVSSFILVVGFIILILSVRRMYSQYRLDGDNAPAET